ncbi:MAG: DNA polymerase/3'-5' exonuclease PolX [Saprospiraceae bacterium]|nr:DNA polymerase/3'-5' exonuclease PolX [Saprospiraceae bacterium]
MNNKLIASRFDMLAKLMELHDENPFKIRSYANAYLSLRKLEGDLSKLSKKVISEIPGVGSAIADKIAELLETGEMQTLNKYLDMTPVGVQQMLNIRGIGPKKVKQIWKELGIESVGELLYACNENRLLEVKGFGLKSQDDIKGKIEYFMDSQGKFLFAHLENTAIKLEEALRISLSQELTSLTGGIRRKMPEVKGIELITTATLEQINQTGLLTTDENNETTYLGYPVFIKFCDKKNYFAELFRSSASDEFLKELAFKNDSYHSEEEIFAENNMNFVVPEFRELSSTVLLARMDSMSNLLEMEDIRGIVHNHSTYSDGLHSLKSMADYVYQYGYEYFVISDHSKSAFYANGLNEERVFMQFREIDDLNGQFDNFKIYKGIESDILSDGSLDYSDDILAQFDLVVASIHSNLNMDKDKATARIIKAVENKYTRILGHPTGRLLLAREGYPLDFKKVIDACAANNVVIELNANPQRLDLDWRWIGYVQEKNVMIAVNPDAHSMESIHYIRYGVNAARKGGLTKNQCLNVLNRQEFDLWLESGK